MDEQPVEILTPREKSDAWRKYINNQRELAAIVASRKGGAVHEFVRWLTQWAWKSQVRAPIDQMFSRGLINSRSYHEAHAFADELFKAQKP